MPLPVYFSDEEFKKEENMDCHKKPHLFKIILNIVTNKISQGLYNKSMLPEIFADSEKLLKSVAFRINYLSELLVFSQRIKEMVLPEHKMAVYEHTLAVMHEHKELNERTVNSMSFVAMACAGMPVNATWITSVMQQVKGDTNNILAMSASLSLYVKRIVIKSKYLNNEIAMRRLAEKLSLVLVPHLSPLLCYDLVVMGKALYSVIQDHITSFCSLYHKELNSDLQIDNIFLPGNIKELIEPPALDWDVLDEYEMAQCATASA
jgi:hypothetical protein